MTNIHGVPVNSPVNHWEQINDWGGHILKNLNCGAGSASIGSMSPEKSIYDGLPNCLKRLV